MNTIETMDLITQQESSRPLRPRESLPKFARSGEYSTVQ